MQRMLMVVFMLVLLPHAGCVREAPRQGECPVTGGESHRAFEELVQQVREGAAELIQEDHSALTSGEFRLLQSGCAGLRRLEVNQSGVDPVTFQETLSALPNLERLKLGGPVSSADLKVIAGLSKLSVLNLPAGEFDDAGLAALEGHPQLELLRFRSSRVTDGGLGTLTRLPRLKSLHLINVPITDAGLVQLYGLKQLESFYLDGGNCTEEGLSQLIKQLPELHFHWNQLHLPNDPRADD